MKKILLVAITTLAFALRLFYLGGVPQSLEWDEVAIGYDAFALLKTGRDQFGNLLPLVFRSLDDWKPPLYEYLSVPIVAKLGLANFSIRIPSAVLGALSSLLTYYLTKEILRNLGKLITRANRERIALTAALFLALSPWHLQFSRAAFEVNIAVFFFIATVLTFLQSFREEKKWLIIATIFFGLLIFSYHSARVVGPILLFSALGLFFKDLRFFPRSILITSMSIISIFIILFLPIGLSKESRIRFKATNILYHRQIGSEFVPGIPQERAARQRVVDESKGYRLSGRVVHNEKLSFLDYEFLSTTLRNYLSHFHPEFLFVRGDLPLHHAPGYGLLHPWELTFLLVGLALLYRYPATRVTLLWIWLLVAPIPAAVTLQAPHAVRTELILPVLQIFTAVGFIYLITVIEKESFFASRVIGVVLIVVFLFNILTYLHQYFIHTNFEVARQWLYGRKEAALFSETVRDKYDKIIVSTKLEQPLVFFLFYLQYDPQAYLNEGGTVSGGYNEDRNHFDKYYFRPIDFEKMRREPRVLLIGSPEEFPPDSRTLRTIYLPSGEAIIQIVAT